MNYWILGLIMATMIGFMACKSDDDPEPEPEEMKRTYTLDPVADPDINGEVTFLKVDDNSTLVTIELVGTDEGETHPAHIHANSASQGGGIVVSLTPVNGATGISETTVTERDDGTPINYEGLINFDGHVNAHLSTSAMSTLVAQGDIGSNATGSNGNGGNGGNGGY